MADFSAAGLPYGVISGGGVVTRVGDDVIALGPLARIHDPELAPFFDANTLNPLMAAGPKMWERARSAMTAWVTNDAFAADVAKHRSPVAQARMVLPFEVADYVDFYSSRDHAENVGKMFRPDMEPLLPNWLHLPVGYHGRAGTVVVSGTDIPRPHGQRKPPDADSPVFGPSIRMDIEAEMGFIVGVGSDSPIAVDDFDKHVFGVALVNDWSARDIQAWEYVPLGPFLGKSFATSISAWITPLAAFADARVPLPAREREELDYLVGSSNWGLDIDLEVELNGVVVSTPPFKTMYWSPAQQLAHMTVNGATARTGDLFASGTISGPNKNQRGSFLELSWSGQEPIELADGSTRTFLEDGDTVRITASAPGPNGSRFALGDVVGTITSATSQ